MTVLCSSYANHSLCGSVFGPAADNLTQILIDAINFEHDVLVLGRIGGVGPSDIVKRNGHAYLVREHLIPFCAASVAFIIRLKKVVIAKFSGGLGHLV